MLLTLSDAIPSLHRFVLFGFGYSFFVDCIKECCAQMREAGENQKEKDLTKSIHDDLYVRRLFFEIWFPICFCVLFLILS